MSEFDKRTYKERYLELYEEKKRNGLISVHFSLMPGAKPVSEEELYEELWRMESAPTLSDSEVLGRYGQKL